MTLRLHQGGSDYIGDRKDKISRPLLHNSKGEVGLPIYSKLKELGPFSEEILTKNDVWTVGSPL